MNESLWTKEIKRKRAKSLKEDLKTDILIIGGGITGISIAYHLRKFKKHITLIDASRIGSKTTANTTGKLTYLQDKIYPKLDFFMGKEVTDLYLKSQIDAIELVKNIIVEHQIKCNFESNSSYLFTNEEKEINKLKKTKEILERNHIKVIEKENLPLPLSCIYAIQTENTAVFHPLKYILALKDICETSGIHIYENTTAIKFEKIKTGYLVTTKKAIIEAKKVIIASHYPSFPFPYLFPMKTYLEKSYVTAGRIDKAKKWNAISSGKNIESIRYYMNQKNYIIYASESRKLSSNMDNEKRYQSLLWNMKTRFTSNIECYWFNYDIMTLDSLPLIGYMEKDNKDLLLATGYNTWGMTNGSLAGKVIADIIQKKENPYIALFNPLRKMSIYKLYQLVNYGFKNGTSLFLSKTMNNYSFYPSNVEVIEKENTKYGIYTDEQGEKHVVYNTCPHLKCDLIFNTVDKTWDCPCHGSRFDINGNCVKGPSIQSIKVAKKENPFYNS